MRDFANNISTYAKRHIRCARVFESAYLTLAPERVGTERGAETSIACRRSTVHAAKAAPPAPPEGPASTRRHATNVKYALSKILAQRM